MDLDQDLAARQEARALCRKAEQARQQLARLDQAALDRIVRQVADAFAAEARTLAELAVAYSIAKGAIPIVGMRKPHHVDAVAKAADAKLSADTLAEIDRRSDELLSKIGA